MDAKTSISLNKFISDTGYCSRREADRLITDGRVLLNNEPAQLGNRYTVGDSVEVDGSLITNEQNKPKKEKYIFIALNKPVGVTCTTDTSDPSNVISFINYPKRIFPIGRLDKDSEGLLFLTNDGDIVNKILRIGNKHDKEYIVTVNKPITDFFIQKMANGVPILGEVTKPCTVIRIGKNRFKIILQQGLNRQIRRMCEHFDYKVETLQRVRIMHISLGKLAVGKYRHLSETELASMHQLLSGSKKNG